MPLRDIDPIVPIADESIQGKHVSSILPTQPSKEPVVVDAAIIHGWLLLPVRWIKIHEIAAASADLLITANTECDVSSS
jgi:hypothetical protein